MIGDLLIGFLEQSSRFLKPVYCGDTVYPLLTITDKVRQRTTGVLTVRSTIHNQRGELVMDSTIFRNMEDVISVRNDLMIL